MATKSCGASSAPVRDSGATQLIRELVARAAPPASPPARKPRPSDQDLLLDDEVDGVRCLLIRVPPKNEPGITLSPREQEIVRMIAKGHANKTIADVLEISAWTVGTHLRRIFAKLQVNTRAAVVARAAASGFLTPPAGPDPARTSPKARS